MTTRTAFVRSLPLALVFFILIAIGMTLTAPQHAASQSGGGVPIDGYAWSDTIGWIDLNCANSGVCGTNFFGLSVNNGQITGYAWSDNVGWISANPSDLSGCPSAPCTATIVNGTLTGWLKALSADNNGWDGFISLSGSSYGITTSGDSFSGYAWGDTNVGWVDFRYARYASSTYGTCAPSYSCVAQNIVQTAASCQQTTVATCVFPAFCSAGSPVCLYPAISFTESGPLSGHLQAVPSLVPQNTPTKLFWDVANVSSCSVSGNDGENWTGSTSGGSGVTTLPIAQQTVFTLTCVGVDSSTATESVVVNIAPVFNER